MEESLMDVYIELLISAYYYFLRFFNFQFLVFILFRIDFSSSSRFFDLWLFSLYISLKANIDYL